MLYLFEHILIPLLDMSVTAAFVAVVVILLRAVLKKRAPKQIICLLWLVVFARLLVPVMVESPVSLVPSALGDVVPGQMEQAENPPTSDTDHNMAPGFVGENPVNTPAVDETPESPADVPGTVITNPPDSVTTPPESDVTQTPTVTPPVLEIPDETEPPVETPPADEETAAPVWMYVIPSVWLIGVLVMLASGIGSYIKLCRRVYDAIRTADSVWEHPSLVSPFILGLFRPRIYLPMGIEGQSRMFILHHERAHLRRLDHIVKPICWLTLALHWFNPLAWIAFMLMSRDIETACDESVIRQLGSEVKADYSATLLALATDKRFPAPSPLSFGEGDAKVRIKNVLKFKKPALWVTIAAVVVAVVAAVCLLTDPVTPKDPDLSAYTTQEAYPGLYFLKEPNSTGGKKITAYKLMDHELVLVGGYDEHPANNFTVLTLADGEKRAVFTDSANAYAAFEKMLATALDPDWPNGVMDSDLLNDFLGDLVKPDLSDCTTMDAWPGLYFFEEQSFSGGAKITAYKLIGGELVLVGGYEEFPANNFTVLIHADGEVKAIFASPDEVYAMFEELLAVACRELDPDWTPLSAVGELFQSALNDEIEIVDPGLNMTATLSELVAATAPTIEMKITEMAAVDLESDGIEEVLLLLETPGTVHGTMILRCTGAGSQIYGYELWARAFNDIKPDGTFSFSGGVSNNGFGRIFFTSDGHEVERITYSESTYSDSTVAYYVNKQPATETEYESAREEWSKQPGVSWVEYTPENAELLLRGLGKGLESPPASIDFLASLPSELVNPDILPTDPEEYYLVAALPESHVYLYAKNHGQDSMLLWNGNFWWPLNGRVAHTSYFFLPEMTLLDANHVAVVSHADKGTGVSRYELVVYEFAEEYQVGSSFYTGMRDYVYDWKPMAEEFNQNNTIVYQAYDNSITMTYNGKTYTSSSWNLGQYYDLENGFTGAAIADGEQVEFQVNEDGTISVRLGLTLASSGEGRFDEDDLFWYSSSDRYYPMGDIGFSLAWTIRFTGGGFEVVDGSLYFPGTNGPSDFSGYEVREEYPGLYFRTATDPISGITWQAAYAFVDGEAVRVARFAPYPENLFVGADGVETDYDDSPITAWFLWEQALIDASMACDYYGFLGALPHDRTTPYGSSYQFMGQVDNIVLYSLSDLRYGSLTLIRQGTDLQIVPYPSMGFHGDSPDLLWQDLDGDGEKELAVICNGAATGTHQDIDNLVVYEWDGNQWIAHKHDLTAAIDTAVENMDWSIDDDGVLTVNVLGLPAHLQESWDELMPNGYEFSLEPSYVYQYSSLDGKLTLTIRFSLMPGAGNLTMCYDVFDFVYEIEYNGGETYTNRPLTIRLWDRYPSSGQ